MIDLTTFPDVTVVCGERQTASIDANAVINPTLIVEVTSPSTESSASLGLAMAVDELYADITLG